MLKADERMLSSLSISQFVCAARGIVPEKSPLSQDQEGECCICGTTTTDDWPIALPKTFTAWQYFQEGTSICPACKHMLVTPDYRRKSWLAQATHFAFLSLPEVREILNDLPEPPWALYITLSYRKHGWMQTHINTSRNRFVLTIDDEEFPLTRESLRTTIEKIRQCALFLSEKEEDLWKGRWLWLKDEPLLQQVGQMALHDPELHEWFITHRFDRLTKALVTIMIPTKKEMKKEKEGKERKEKLRRLR